jgi:hemerythrin-like domain-containing protein
MDPTKLLEADHRTVERLFAKIAETDGEKRRPLIDELVTALRGHLDLEERLLYPRMAPITGEEAVTEATTEHQLTRTALEQLMQLAPDQPGFGAALDAAKAGVEHHVDEEEHSVFPALRRDGSSLLDEVAPAMLEQRRRLGLPTDGAALASVSTKQELEHEARRAGISGYSSMSKDQLAQSLAASVKAGQP